MATNTEKRMKSIKEKAEKHLNSVYAGYDDVLKELVKESYVSGANYVLDEIEKLIYEKHVEGNLPLFDLTYLIDKLKEK